MKQLTKKNGKTLIGSTYSREEVNQLISTYYSLYTAKNEMYKILKTSDCNSMSNIVITKQLENLNVTIDSLVLDIRKIVLSSESGKWLMKIVGIDEIIALELLFYFDVSINSKDSNFISYAGLNDNNRPLITEEEAVIMVNNVVGKNKINEEHIKELSELSKWSVTHLKKKSLLNNDKGYAKSLLINAISVPPYNPELKNLCTYIGFRFKEVSDNNDSLYGKIYKERFNYELVANPTLHPDHICSRSRRYALKIFIRHLFTCMYLELYKEEPTDMRQIIGKFSTKEEVNIILPEVPYNITKLVIE